MSTTFFNYFSKIFQLFFNYALDSNKRTCITIANKEKKVSELIIPIIRKTEKELATEEKKFLDWKYDYSDYVEWNEFRDSWRFCTECGNYSEGQCLCYTRK